MRMGLRWIKGLQQRDVETLLEVRAARKARGAGRWRDLDELTREANLARKPLLLLAGAGALEGFDRTPRAIGDRTSTRRDAAWAVRGALTRSNDSLTLRSEASEQQPTFARLDRDEAMLWDYRTSVHSTRGHPLETLRPQLDARGYPTADRLGSMPEGRRFRYVGLVICRQRPGTASGVTFCTLEDETGFVNLVIWAQVFERFSLIARTAMLLGVTGRIQTAEGVVHLIADELWEPDFVELDTEIRSRDFH